MSTIKSENGKVIKINSASFEDSCDLKDAIETALAEAGIDLSSFDFSFKNIKDLDISFVVKPLLKISSSKEVRRLIFKCLERSSFDEEKITVETFDNIENRGDYYPVALECIKVNVLPFFSKLLSRFVKVEDVLKGAFNPEQK